MSYYSFLPKLINMSLTASVAIILVILLRLLLRKAPKAISYALWGVVLFRLLCPVSIGSDFSVYNLFDAPTEESGTVTSVIEYIPSDIVHTEYPVVTLPVPGISDAINETLPQGEEQLRADPLEGPLFIAAYLWLTGVAVMVCYSMVSFAKLRRKLLVVVPLRDNIFIADDIKSPFVVGFFRPRIYLPCNLSEKEQEYIILHEQHHIKRFDHIVKPISFIALSIHWFNPLVWVAFTLAAKDMEMSCDEAVIRKVGSHVRADYSASLLTLATGHRIIAGAPLAFGEGDTKGRINNLSKWKKPAVQVVALAVVACIVLAVGLLTNPKQDSYTLRIVVPAGSQESIVYSDEEISSLGHKIRISSGEGLSDTEVKLKPVEVKEENSYDEVAYLTPGMPVEIEVEKGAWFKIGVNMQNNTDEDKIVYVNVENVVVRIPSNVTDSQIALDNIKSVTVDGISVSDEATSDLISLINSHSRTTFRVGTDDPNSLSRAIQLNCSNGDFYLLHYQYYSSLSFDPNHTKGGDYRSILTFFTAEEGGTQAWKMEQDFDGKLQEWLSKHASSNQTTAPEEDPLDAAIRSAIIEVNRHPKDPDGLYHCASFVLLQQVELSFDSDPPEPNEVTVYGVALYQPFSFSDGVLRDAGGSHTPVAITFEVENGKYNLKEYWQPGDGSYYVSDIRDKFPDESEEKALDTQKYIRAQIQNCYAQAVEFGGVDTTTAIEELFTIIESSPLHSSNPGDYINEHSIEYRELTYYGQYTLRYCFEQFLQGNQTGLRGHLMRAVIDDIAPESKLQIQTMTGQEYFDAWKDAALRIAEEHSAEWIKGNRPAAWILLQMMGEYVIELDKVSALVSEKGYTGEDFKEELLGQFNENIIHSWGKSDFDISGFGSQLGHPGWAQIWYLDEENHQRITLYLNEKGYVEDILIDTTENN